MLRRFAHATGLHITAMTGFHQRKYYPADSWLWTAASADDVTAYFVEELTLGTRESRGAEDGSEPIPATMLKVGYEGTIEGRTRVLMQAVA